MLLFRGRLERLIRMLIRRIGSISQDDVMLPKVGEEGPLPFEFRYHLQFRSLPNLTHQFPHCFPRCLQ